MPGLRFGLSRTDSVVISVPRRRTKSAALRDQRRLVDAHREQRASRAGKRASSANGANLPPQALKPKSHRGDAARPSTTKIGPLSRTQESSMGSPATSTGAPSRTGSRGYVPGRAITVTGSKRAMASTARGVLLLGLGELAVPEVGAARPRRRTCARARSGLLGTDNASRPGDSAPWPPGRPDGGWRTVAAASRDTPLHERARRRRRDRRRALRNVDRLQPLPPRRRARRPARARRARCRRLRPHVRHGAPPLLQRRDGAPRMRG